MGSRGPAPKRDAARKNKGSEFTQLVAGDEPAGFELPDDVLPFLTVKGEVQFGVDGEPLREEWHPQTVRWWEHWRRSPQASRMLSEPDWDYLLDTALLHHQMWASGGKNSERAAEIRMRVKEFGVSPEARLRLRAEILVPDEYAVGGSEHRMEGATVTQISSRRSRITNGDV